MERNKDLKPSDPNGHGHGPQLLPMDEVEEAIASMLRIWGVYVTAGVLGQYREQLAGLSAAAVLAAVKRWLRAPPADRAARPHELRTMAEGEEGRRPSPVVPEPPPPRRDLDAILAELAAENPENPQYLWIMRERAQAKANGQPMDAEQTAMRLAIQGHVLPGAGPDTPMPPAPDQR
jgi:hypothetical protein